ncbi:MULTISPECIES: VOC family protein [Haloarcula]|uniref:VOC family protein n=1 Tax=Haloarcula TaxID=2237 RepID=UPI0023EC81E4|nr:VOC family protein [Halomicroarcula sp. XH51]
MTDAGTIHPETTVGRVALTVADLDGVATFYETVVGLVVHDRTDARVVLGDGTTPLLELVAAPDRPERGRDEAGLFHVAVRVPTRAALGAALERVEAGARLDGASDHHVSEALYLSDPEGNGVEIYRDRPRDEWPERPDGRVQMDTLPLSLDGLRAESDGGGRAPVGTDVGHVHLEVTDLEAARSFYVDTLGLSLRQEMQGALFVAAGDYHHHLGLNSWRRRTAPQRGRGLAWFELRVPDAAALTAVRERLEAAGLAVADRDDGIAVTAPDAVSLRLRAVE